MSMRKATPAPRGPLFGPPRGPLFGPPRGPLFGAPLGLLLGLLFLTGCGGSSKSADVTVTGTLGWSGGVQAPSSPPYRVMPGTVRFKGAGTTTTVSADANGRFTARVPRGSYAVTGTSSHFIVNGAMATCRTVGGPVDASRDRTGILVLCNGK